MRLNMLFARTAQAPRTHEGAPARRISTLQELRRTSLACMLWEDEFYEDGVTIAERVKALVPQVPAAEVAALAVEARTAMKLRHLPLLLAREMARLETHRGLVGDLLPQVIQRADELAEFLAIYWQGRKPDDRKRPPLAAQVKKGLARAIARFDAYQLAKYDRDGAVKLRDVLRLVHPTPTNGEQAALWKGVIDGTLASPDTWEVALSGGADKKATFERLIAEHKLGALALLRNLRGMLAADVDVSLVRKALSEMKTERVLPFRFITAARHAPSLEPELEVAMFRSLAGVERLPGRTVLLIDVSDSMNAKLSGKSQMTRMEAACGLAILAREVCEDVAVFTFSNSLAQVPPRRGFALRDAVVQSQPHSGTYLGKAVQAVNEIDGVDRLIVFTDEQSHDAVPNPTTARTYMVNVASAKHGVGYGKAWTHLDGFSEAVLKWIAAYEAEQVS